MTEDRMPTIEEAWAGIILERVAYHEAGHAVVALATDWGLREVCIGPKGGHILPVMGNRFTFPHPLSNVEDVRGYNVVLAAGELASKIHNSLDNDEGWPDEDSLWGYIGEGRLTDPHCLLSEQFVLGGCVRGEVKDVDYAVRNARVIWKTILYLEDIGRFFDSGGKESPVEAWRKRTPRKFVLNELISAEQKADKVLKAHWSAVDKLAGSLLQLQSGLMTGDEVRALIGDLDEGALAA